MIYRNLLFLVLLIAIRGYGSEFNLRYDSNLKKNGFPSPVVDISINGITGIFLVDSGASVSVLSSWFAETSKVVVNGQATVSGSAGSSSNSKSSFVDLALKTTANKTFVFKNRTVAIVQLPDVFRSNGLAGILSPQQLLSAGEYCFIDLRSAPRMEIESDKAPMHTGTSTHLSLIFSSSDGPKTILYTLHALVENVPVTLIVDTGAGAVSVGMGTVPGKALLSRSTETDEKIGGITGIPVPVRLVPNAIINLLTRVIRTDVRLQVTSDKMPADGMLGMEFLKNCSLRLTNSDGLISCQ